MKFSKIFALICVLCFSISLITVGNAKKANEAVVSQALNIISKNSLVAFSDSDTRTISFEASDFEKVLNLSKISSITVTALPSRADGILYIGGSEVTEGQTISSANIGYLSFEFVGENISKSSFCFKTDLGAHEIEADIYSLKRANSAPTTAIDGITLASTYKNVSFYGKLAAYDADGDLMVYEIIKQPKNGLLEVEADGSYVYTPKNGYVGDDSFKYVAVDKYGNYSASREISLSVELQRSSVVFEDIKSGRYHVAAISMSEKGIMSAQEVDGKYYFSPDGEVSRLEFLVMAMKNMGIEVSIAHDAAVFADNDKIPNELRGYVNTAAYMGLVTGRIEADGCLVFAPHDKITGAEAAVILSKMTDIEEPVLRPVFANSNELPAWAEDAVYCLSARGIMPVENGYVSLTQPLKRDEAAFMLYGIYNIFKE